MADIKVRVKFENEVKIRLGSENKIKVIPSIGSNTIGSLIDVDMTNATDGSILVYDSSIKRWIATSSLIPEVD
jgi:hypothetical protein